jgi:HEPN domain-containing protein
VPITRKDLQALAEARLADAQILFRHKRYDAAYYLAGYAVECALKACVAKKTKRHDFPAKKDTDKAHTHDLQALLSLSGVGEQLNDFHDDPTLGKQWSIVKQWSEASRYYKSGNERAGAIISAVSGAQGVLQCLKEYW